MKYTILDQKTNKPLTKELFSSIDKCLDYVENKVKLYSKKRFKFLYKEKVEKLLNSKFCEVSYQFSDNFVGLELVYNQESNRNFKGKLSNILQNYDENIKTMAVDRQISKIVKPLK